MAFTVVDEFDDKAFGGGCFGCGSPRRNQEYRPQGEMLVDLGPLVDCVEDLDGNLHGFKKPILCETCIRELTTLIGGLVPEQIDRDNLDHWQARAKQAESRVKDLEELMTMFKELTA